MLDKNEKFTVTTIIRREIADQLNDYLFEWSHDHIKKFKLGDDRLTTEICTEHARKMGLIPTDDEDTDVDEAAAQVCLETMAMMGYDLR